MFKRLRRGEVALATMILFIALILVAAATVGILISSADIVQTKALTTAKDTTRDVGFGFQVLEVYATDGSSGNDVDYFYWMVKVASGSDSGFYNETMIEMKLSNNSQSYNYIDSHYYTMNYTYWNDSFCNGTEIINETQVNITFSVDCTNFNATIYKYNVNETVHLNSTGDVCDTGNTTFQNASTTPSSSVFAKSVTKAPSSSVSGKYLAGEIFQVCMKAPRSVGQDEKVILGLVPRQGDSLRINFVTPAVIRNQRIYLYP